MIRNFQHVFSIHVLYISGVGALLPASVNEKIISSHMLMLSLEHEKLLTPAENAKSFNIYQVCGL